MQAGGTCVLRLVLRVVAIVSTIAIAALGCASDPAPAQPSPLLALSIVVPECQNGRVLAPGAQTTLRVAVTEKTGAPAKGTTVRFVAPDSGASGSFAGDDPAGPSYGRATTDDTGIASIDLVTNATPGAYLVDVLVENAEAQTTFAITNTPEPAPAVSADQARCRLEQDPAYDPKAVDRLIHGPMLLGAGTTITSGEPDGPSAPIFTAPGPTWFFWVDDHHSAAFAHGSRFVAVDTSNPASSPLVFPSEWWPVITAQGAAPAALRSPWRVNVRSEDAPTAPSRPRPASLTKIFSGARTGVVPLADPPGTKSCVIIMHGLHDDAFKNTAKDVRDHVKRVHGITNVYMNPNDATGNPAPPTKADLGKFIDQAIADGCTKIYFFSFSHGYRGGASGFSDGAGKTVAFPYEEMANLFKTKLANTNLTLCVTIFACYSGSALRAFDGIGISGEIFTSSDEQNLSYMTPGFFRQTTWFMDELQLFWSDFLGTPGEPRSLKDAFTMYRARGGYFYNLSQNPQTLTLSPQPDPLQVPAVTIDCPGDVVAVDVPLPAAGPGSPPIAEKESGTITSADPTIADVGPAQIVFEKSTGVGRKNIEGKKTGSTTYTVTLWRMPEGRFEGTGTITVGKCATFTVNPIVATFDQASFSTTYQIVVTNPQGEPLTVTWSGPDCGTYTPMEPSAPSSAPAFGSTMTWTHPHPPCDASTDHESAIITATVTGSNGTKICTYKGADSGQGAVCTNKK